MKKRIINKIEIELCDNSKVQLDMDSIIRLEIKGISKNCILNYDLFDYNTEVIEYENCKSLKMAITKEMNITEETNILMIGKQKPFERIISKRDIFAINIGYEDGEGQKIVVPWKKGQTDGEYENKYQKAYIDSNGCLEIEIKKR